MTYTLARIDKYTKLSDTLAVSGQPSLSQFKVIKEAGYQIVVRLKIAEIESSIADERQIVEDLGLLYEEIPVSFNTPSETAFADFTAALEQNKQLNIFVHCTAGYCTSGFLLPYLMLYKGYTQKSARQEMIVQQFNEQWETFINEMIVQFSAIAS